jgi:hypothetical protein
MLDLLSIFYRLILLYFCPFFHQYFHFIQAVNSFSKSLYTVVHDEEYGAEDERKKYNPQILLLFYSTATSLLLEIEPELRH